MALSTKGKRKLVFKEKDFYWWVKEDFDGNGNMLSVNIASKDKKFLIKYFSVVNDKNENYIQVIGNNFVGLDNKTSNKNSFYCPNFITDIQSGIKPNHIESILNWCFLKSKKLTPKK